MISVDGLTVEFGGSALFSDVSFVINEKIYLVEDIGRRAGAKPWKSVRP